jgi:hypothetical protein
VSEQTDLEKLTADVEELNSLLKDFFSYTITFHATVQRSYSTESIAKQKVARIRELLGVQYQGLAAPLGKS